MMTVRAFTVTALMVFAFVLAGCANALAMPDGSLAASNAALVAAAGTR
ncbi:MAG: hypothetical protein ACLPTB_11465 [Acidimicrobiales bacterium]|jgi:hypothetical protein